MNIGINNPETVREAAGWRLATEPGLEAAARPRANSLLRVSFVVNGDTDSAMAHRARAFARHLGQHDIRVAYRSSRKIVSILSFLLFLLRTRPALTYVFDISYSGVLAATIYRIAFGNRLVIDTGDAITDLARSMGRDRIGLLLTRLLERLAFWAADRVVVRGTFHRQLLARAGFEAEVIQDGVDLDSFAPDRCNQLRRQHALENVLTIGLVGTSVWSEKLRMCYGWELVETIRLLKDKPVKGIMIGSGSGIAHLKARCRDYGIEDRILFFDYVPYDQLARHLGLIDVCLSTQTNDVVGNVRTTGKLPLYLAAGRFVLASNVGEAARVLPSEMLVDYEGVKDEAYPAKLAGRIESLIDGPATLSSGQKNIALAREHFEYSILAPRVERVIAKVLKEAE